MTTPYDHLIESASTLEVDDLRALAAALQDLVKEKEPKAVAFTVRQQATLTCTTRAEVPQAVLAQGDAATIAWLWDNQDKWEDEDMVTTDYQSYIDGSLALS